MAGVFTLEALDAAHGDALLLHYGPLSDPRLIVIDGGPAGVFRRSLSPRLEEIHAARGGGVLEIRLLMVSHIDDDHIVGVLDLARTLRDLQSARAPLPFDILTLWHNSFDDIAGRAGEQASSVLRGAAARGGARSAGDAIIASVPQGRQLRLDADRLGLNMNSGFDDLIRFDAADAAPLNMGAGLRFTVLGPRRAELDALEKKWDREVKALLARKRRRKRGGGSELAPADFQALAAAFVDDSIHNLSSLVVLAERDGHRILLTGDARGDFIIASLREAGLLQNGRLRVDVFKMPHHGSIHNADKPMFKAIVADHYVFSANGRDDNPDTETLALLFAARPRGAYHLWLTNNVTKAVRYIKRKKPSGVRLHVRDDDALGVRIELGQPIRW
jgi:beta-lactamase superfamily II metal-dependent hydrolase